MSAMARILYADETQAAEVAALATQIRKERGRIHNLYRMLLNARRLRAGGSTCSPRCASRGRGHRREQAGRRGQEGARQWVIVCG